MLCLFIVAAVFIIFFVITAVFFLFQRFVFVCLDLPKSFATTLCLQMHDLIFPIFCP